MVTALITGVNGQDGSYLAELLLEKGYRVVGWIPRMLPADLDNIQHILDRIELVRGDLSDAVGMLSLIERYRPDEVYNLAAPSSPSASWDAVVEVGDTAGLGVARWLEAIRRVKPRTRFYQASSSELFGNPVEVPQNEKTPYHPRNPYGVAKMYAHWMVENYRNKYGLFAVSGILYNHESPRRGQSFVTRKITTEAARIKLGMSKQVRLGNLEARRDWGYAGDYVRGMWMMLQQPDPIDYVIGTGETFSVRDVCEIAFAEVGLDYQEFVVQDERFYRPVEEAQLVADPRLANQVLGWKPQVSFKELICMMVRSDLERLDNGITG